MSSNEPQIGSPIMLSFKELQGLRDRMTKIDTKLDVALTLPAKIAEHEDRIVSLETTRTVQESRGGLYGKAWEVIYGLILAFIAAGVWFPHK